MASSVMTNPIWLALAVGNGCVLAFLFSVFTQAGSIAQRVAKPPIECATMITFPGPPSPAEVLASQLMHLASCGPIALFVTHCVFTLL